MNGHGDSSKNHKKVDVNKKANAFEDFFECSGKPHTFTSHTYFSVNDISF